MRTLSKYLTLLILLTLVSCGNYKGNVLPEGVKDKSTLQYPPNLQKASRDNLLFTLDELLNERN